MTPHYLPSSPPQKKSFHPPLLCSFLLPIFFAVSCFLPPSLRSLQSGKAKRRYHQKNLHRRRGRGGEYEEEEEGGGGWVAPPPPPPLPFCSSSCSFGNVTRGEERGGGWTTRNWRWWWGAAQVPNQQRWNMYTLHTRFCTSGTNLYAQSVLISKISASELRRKFIVLLVG